MALKANCPDDGPGTLTVVVMAMSLLSYFVFFMFVCMFLNVVTPSVLQLARQPLFFRETNPQPRKHTLWQATADFTDGQASIHR